MKLLLTSGGIRNQSIADALADLVGRPASEVKIAYIPTAANAEEGNKDWFINQFLCFWRYGYSWIDVVDPSAADVDWKARLEDVDVVFVSGGNTFHLLNQYRQTGFGQWLTDNLDTKVYVGVSAGTIVTAPSIDVAAIEPADRNFLNLKDLTGLNVVDFEIEPHCVGERFAVIESYAKDRSYPVYAIDDNTAIKVTDDKIEVVSEGVWEIYE